MNCMKITTVCLDVHRAYTMPETRAASLSLVAFPDVSLVARHSRGRWESKLSLEMSALGSSMSPLSKHTLCKNAQDAITWGANVGLTSRALKSVELHLVFIMPKALSIMLRALE